VAGLQGQAAERHHLLPPDVRRTRAAHRGPHEVHALRSGGTDRYNSSSRQRPIREDGVYFNNFQTLNTLRGNFSFVHKQRILTFATNIGLSHNHHWLPLNDNVAAA
jgi:hypothetical protein